MVNLESIFTQLYEGVTKANPRYSVVDEDHVADTQVGISYHLYPAHKESPYKITKGEQVLLTGVHMTDREAKILDMLSYHLQKHFADARRDKLYQMVYECPAPTSPDQVGGTL